MKKIVLIPAVLLATLLISTCGRTGPSGPPDLTPPLVASVAPSPDATMPVNIAALAVRFNEELDASTITNQTVWLEQAGELVEGSVSYQDRAIYFKPAANLDPTSSYTLVISEHVKDLAGNALVQAFRETFWTGAESDTTPPTVSESSPAGEGVSENPAISVTFSEAMLLSSITQTTFYLARGSDLVAGEIRFNGTTQAIFSPSGALAYKTTYSVTITKDVVDMAGNPLGSDYNWSFTTGSEMDKTAPTVTGILPTGKNALIGASVSISFSEAIDPSTLRTDTILIRNSEDDTLVDWTMVPGSATAEFKPSLPLDYNTVYVVTVTTGVKDLAGNPLAASYVRSFTTEKLDTTPDSFSFTELRDVAPNMQYISNSITVSGTNAPVSISITGGTYSLDRGITYTSALGTVTNGQTVIVQQTSSQDWGTMTEAVLTIGEVNGAFRVTTAGLDTRPDIFTFETQTNVSPGAQVTSNTITVSGINAPAPISIANGSYSVDGGFTYTSEPGTVTNGQPVTVQQTASAIFGTTTIAELTIGGVTGTFSVSTAIQVTEQ